MGRPRVPVPQELPESVSGRAWLCDCKKVKCVPGSKSKQNVKSRLSSVVPSLSLLLSSFPYGLLST